MRRVYAPTMPGVVVVHRVRRKDKPRRECPAITTGTFADGTPCIVMRWLREDPTTGTLVSDGASLTLAEWREANVRVEADIRRREGGPRP